MRSDCSQRYTIPYVKALILSATSTLWPYLSPVAMPPSLPLPEGVQCSWPLVFYSPTSASEAKGRHYRLALSLLLSSARFFPPQDPPFTIAEGSLQWWELGLWCKALHSSSWEADSTMGTTWSDQAGTTSGFSHQPNHPPGFPHSPWEQELCTFCFLCHSNKHHA